MPPTHYSRYPCVLCGRSQTVMTVRVEAADGSRIPHRLCLHCVRLPDWKRRIALLLSRVH